jgi:hypothetical protein
MKLTKKVVHYQSGQVNDREVVATYGDRAILETPLKSREEWVRSSNARSHLMVVDGTTYEFNAPLPCPSKI